MLRHFTHMIELHVIENYRESYPELKGSRLTDALIKDCLREAGFDDADILRTKKGKPYVKYREDSHVGTPDAREIYISASHSGIYFVCTVADCPIGVDVQEERKVNVDGISRRYFSAKEQDYVKNSGKKGFFTLWTRKEAYSKYTGLGLEELMKGAEVLEREDVEFFDFQLEDGIYCSYCITRGMDR